MTMHTSANIAASGHWEHEAGDRWHRDDRDDGSGYHRDSARVDGDAALPVAASEGVDGQVTGEMQVAVGDETSEEVVAVPVPSPGGCTIDRSGLPVIDLINESSVLADFLLTIALHDGAGATVSQQPAEIYALRPGERTIEHVVVQEPGGVECTVVEMSRLPIEVTATLPAEVASCEITGPTASGEIAATISIANSGEETIDVLVDLAFADPSGLRRGTGLAIADGLDPGATVRVDVDTFVPSTPELLCQVVGVTRHGGLTPG